MTRSLVSLFVSIWWFLLLLLILVSFPWYWSVILIAFFYSKDLQMSFLKPWNQFFQEPVAILVIPQLQSNRIYLLQSWCRIFVALSFFVLDAEGYLRRDCYSFLILKRLTILLTVCVHTVRCIFWVFLEWLNANKSLLVFLIYRCSASDIHR